MLIFMNAGNGMTDFSTMIPSYYDMTCTPASLSPVLDIRYVTTQLDVHVTYVGVHIAPACE